MTNTESQLPELLAAEEKARRYRVVGVGPATGRRLILKDMGECLGMYYEERPGRVVLVDGPGEAFALLASPRMARICTIRPYTLSDVLPSIRLEEA